MNSCRLGIIVNNKRVAKFELANGGEVFIGRRPSHTNGIKINEPNLSSNHAQVMMNENGEVYLVDLWSTNGTFLNQRRIEPNVPYPISAKDEISFVLGSNIRLVFNPDDFSSSSTKVKTTSDSFKDTDIMGKFAQKNVLTIGRNESCDVVLRHHTNTISKVHASIERKANGKFYLKDLGSLNGTYLNGSRITHEVLVNESDFILIGRFIINLKGKARNLSEEISVRAERIVKEFANGYQGLKQTSFEIPSESLIAVMGPSGCGKSTLLKALCGDSPPTSGSVSLFGLELNSNYDFLKTQIGYVPQDDIVHRELTVDQSLFYAAKLRLPNASNEAIKEKINQVLKELNITHIRASLVGKISGGQRKRVSIAVEILTDPMILFLDEPTSPLDPQTIEEFLGILKELAKKGTTVIMVTHKPDDLDFMDSVIFMAEGGYIAYHDSVDGYKNYFGVQKTREVYAQLENPRAEIWIEKRRKVSQGDTTGAKSPSVKHSGKANVFSQYKWLTARYFNIKLNDKVNSFWMVAQAPIIAILVCIIFKNVTQAVPFLMAISAIWFGTNNAAREIVSELPIYKRERMFNQGVFPYIFSKITVLGAFAALQAFLFTVIIVFFYQDSSETSVAWNNGVSTFNWMLLISLASSVLGLFLSAIVDTSEKVMTIVPIALIPQIMLAGVVASIQNKFVEFLSYITLSRWGTEGFCIVQKEVVTETLTFQMVDGTGVIDKTLNPPAFVEPEFHIEAKDTIVNAVENLNKQFHESYDVFGDLKGTLRLDVLAIMFLTLIFFAGIFIALKRKDPIKIK